ncbi:copper amine oxidase N-terminal domain-containing protein [Paenibacillus methanolicus]|uniref:Copper amine oxidase-like protein n=1 Tax=Paenibacillus methanolicus TaxID=582686 RepID=A0A5S5C8E3_9BACL|nr:copper amine oxidase N-terminal domain-containing protein [Paenibacillus methanolicus]TYP75671.1 copper amine oxidase-like protein [Paenibacillus methanolicus]
MNWLKTSKFFVSFCTLGLLLFTLQTMVAAAPTTTQPKVTTGSYQLVFDGKVLQLPEGQHIFALNGTTYVPMRFVSYALKKSVQWDASSNRVTVKDPTKSETIALNEFLMNAMGTGLNKGGSTVQIKPVAAKFVFDGATKALPKGQGAYALNGTIYVPLRFMSESAGSTIYWDAKAQQISARSKGFNPNAGTSTGGNGTSGSTDGGQANNNGQTSGGTSGSTGGGTASKPSYESITSNAQARLTNLQNSCQAALMDIGIQYISTEDAKTKESLKSKGYAQLDSCTSSFNQVLAETEAQLTANGYSTAILADYRQTFNAQVEKGREIMAGML